MTTQSWFDPGQNRESGGADSERTDYATSASTTLLSGGGPPDPT